MRQVTKLELALICIVLGMCALAVKLTADRHDREVALQERVDAWEAETDGVTE